MNPLIVITGGTKGIGKAIALTFANNGFDVATCARDEAALNELKSEIEGIGVKAFVYTKDLSEKTQCQEFVAEINKLKSTVKVLVNNTGIFLPGKVHNEEEGSLEQMIQTNLYSAYHITRGLIHEMIASKKGHIFNICSTASITPYVNGGSYCISKYAMYGMTKVLREEMKEHNVRVTAILPGATHTSSWDGIDIPEERFMKASDVADTIWNSYQMSDRTVIEEIVMRPQLGDL